MAVSISGGELDWKATIDDRDFMSRFDQMERKINNFSNNVQNNGSKIDSFFKTAGAAVAGYLSLQAFGDFTRKIIEVSSEFQKFEAVLTNTLGSNALANSVMDQIQDFAAKTPFGVRELTDAFVKLANQGFVPSGKQMRMLGDLAASTGKSFNQLAEAILDAQTGEYERLKEFGIKARDAGDKVIFTFKGVKTEVDKSSTAIRNYITNLGDAEGVSGSMAAISKTLGGQISNLEDNWDKLLKTIGEGTTGVFSDAISVLSQMLEAVTEYIEKVNIANEYDLKPVESSSAKFFAGPLGGLLSTMESFNAEGQTDFIQNLREGLTKENNLFIAGAKSLTAYRDQWIKLEKDRKNSIAGIKDDRLRNAINSEFEKVKVVLKDQSAQILKDRNKPKDAGFGKNKTGKTDAERQADNIKKAYKSLDDELKFLSIDKKLSLEDIDNRKVSAYEGLIKSLISNGIEPGDKAIQSLLDKIFTLNKELNDIEGNKFEANLFSKKSEQSAKQAVQSAKDLQKELEELSSLPFPDISKPLTIPKTTIQRIKEFAGKAYAVSDAFYSWSDSLNGVDDDLSKTMGQISNIANGVGNVATGFASLTDKESNPLEKILGGAGMIGAALGAVKGIVSLFDNSEAKRRQAQEQQAYSQSLQLKAINAQTEAMERQLALIKDLYGAERLQKYGESLDTISKKFQEQSVIIKDKIINTGFDDIDKQVKKLNNGEQIGHLYQPVVAMFQKAGKFKTVGSVLPELDDILKSTEALGKLEDLVSGGLLDEKSAATAQSLITLAKQYRDTLNEVRAETTGTTFSGIADEIVQMFENGTTAAEDFGKNFEQIMKKSILNSFKRNALEKELQKFYEDFAAKAETGGGLDQGEIGSLKTMYDAIIANSQKQFEDLQKATGVSFNNPNAAGASANSLAGGIQRSITEETGSLIAGQFNGMRMTAMEQLTVAKQHMDIALKIEANTFRTANNTDHLSEIKDTLKSMDTKISSNSNALVAGGIKP